MSANPKERYLQARQLWQAGKHHDAEVAYRQIIRDHAAYPFPYYDLGTLLESANPQEAAHLYDRFIDLAAGNVGLASLVQKAGDRLLALRQMAAPPAVTAPPTEERSPQKREFNTLQEALEAANPGGRITLSPGVYEISVIIRNPIEIFGADERTDTILFSNRGPVLTIDSDHVIISNLTVENRNPDEQVAVECLRGTSVIEKCDIRSKAKACVVVGTQGGMADPVLRNCRIMGDGSDWGLVFANGNRGRIEGCQVWGHKLGAVSIGSNANPVFIKTDFCDNDGVGMHTAAGGVLEDCAFYNNKSTGLLVVHNGDPAVRRCSITDVFSHAVWVRDNSRGNFEGCEFSRNFEAQVRVSGSASPNFTDCTINEGGAEGVLLEDQSKAVFDRCSIKDNTLQNVVVAGQAKPQFKQCQVSPNS